MVREGAAAEYDQDEEEGKKLVIGGRSCNGRSAERSAGAKEGTDKELEGSAPREGGA